MTLYAQALANYGDVSLNPDATAKDRNDAQFALTAARKAAEHGEHTLSPQQLEALAKVTAP